MTKPHMKYGNGTWSANCPAGAWGVGTTPEEAYKRWSGIAQSMREKAAQDAANKAANSMTTLGHSYAADCEAKELKPFSIFEAKANPLLGPLVFMAPYGTWIG